MFIDKIKENSLKLRNTVAYVSNNHKLTYGDLWEKSSNLADYLRNNGEGPVIIYGHKSPYMIISFLACIISGRAYVPCDISFPTARLEYMILQTKSKTIIATEMLELENRAVINSEILIKLCSIKNECPLIYNENNIAYIIFTSGSTGTPKGVSISIKNLDNFINWSTNILAISSVKNATVFNQAAFSFDLSVADIYISLVQGHTLFASTHHEQEDLALLFKRLKESNCSLIVCTPTFMQMCLCDCDFNRELLPMLKVVFFCGEVLTVKIAQKLTDRFLGIRIINAYGPTEATCAVIAVEITEGMMQKPSLPIGQIDNSAVEISIVDGEKELSNSVCGEIMLHGASISSGYLLQKSHSIISDNYYHTGDIGKIENGFLYYYGRMDEQIKYKGYRIELTEIELCINDIDGIANAVVVPIEGHDDKILMLIAFVRVTKEITSDDIKAELSKKLPRYMIPKSILIVDKIPMNQNGKCDRKALKEGFFNGANC